MEATSDRPPSIRWATIKRIKARLSQDQVTLISAGVAFYLVLAVFPALAALVSLFGLFADPATVNQQIDEMRGTIPGSAADILASQADRIASQSSNALGWGLIFGIAASLWSANRGTQAIIKGLNIVHDAEERRGFIKLILVSLGITLSGVVLGLLLFAAIAVLPPLLKALFPVGGLATLIFILKWPFLAIIVIGAFGCLYREAPSRPDPGWRWVSRGAVVGGIGWVVISLGFSFYAQNFGNYNAVYGSLGGVIIFFLWLFLSALALLLGAEVNDVLEKEGAAASSSKPRLA